MNTNQQTVDGTPTDQERSLIENISREHNLDPEVVVRLLELSREFPDPHAWGARANLKRRVAHILRDSESKFQDSVKHT